jgi:hypothetical protein
MKLCFRDLIAKLPCLIPHVWLGREKISLTLTTKLRVLNNVSFYLDSPV